MARFRELKSRLAALCASPDWRALLESSLGTDIALKEAVNALLALLPRPEFRLRAAFGLGIAVSRMAGSDMEGARVIMRRLMWSLNEESGNLGWGVPEAMGVIVSMSPSLAREYARIFLSYGYETGKDDNFIDHAPLRRGVYQGAALLARADYASARPILPHLEKALADEDTLVRASAGLALKELAGAAPASEFSGSAAAPWQTALRAVEAARTGHANLETLEFLDNGAVTAMAGSEMLAQAEELLRSRMSP